MLAFKQLEPYEQILIKTNKKKKQDFYIVKDCVPKNKQTNEKPFYCSNNFIGNLLTISITFGIIEMIKDSEVKNIGKTLSKHFKDIETTSLETIRSFKQQISDEGLVKAQEKGTLFHKKHMKSANKITLISFCIGICENLYFKKNKDKHILEKNIRNKLGLLIDKLFLYQKYIDRNLNKFDDYDKAKQYEQNFLKIMFDLEA